MEDKKYILVSEFAKLKGINRTKLYYMIITGKLKEGVDWKETVRQVKRFVVRKDLDI